MSYTLADLLTGQLHYSEDTVPPALSEREFMAWLANINEYNERQLTKPMIEVLILILRGICVRESAAILGSTENNITSHRGDLYSITNLSRYQMLIASYVCDHLTFELRSQRDVWRSSWLKSLPKQNNPKHRPTERESVILDLLLRGISTGQIANSLSVAQRTTETHIYRLLTKLGFDSVGAMLAHFAHHVHHHCLPVLHLEAA